MERTKNITCTESRRGSAVLMARLVDGQGACLRPSSLAGIRYSVFRLDPARPSRRMPVTGHVDVPLEVARVVRDKLEIGGAWDVDVVGYNFRHEISGLAAAPFPRSHVAYHIQYELTLRDGSRTLLKFLVRQ
jgi:hypothetical protein